MSVCDSLRQKDRVMTTLMITLMCVCVLERESDRDYHYDSDDIVHKHFHSSGIDLFSCTPPPPKKRHNIKQTENTEVGKKLETEM